MRLTILVLFVTALAGCQTDAQPPGASVDQTAFNDYWYSGDAELTSYSLEQARYGQQHPGTAVLIFVTEDFSRAKHVKLDRPQNHPDDAVSVLKLNGTRQFNTGVYQYNMMQSVFTPVSSNRDPHTMKVTMSSQDWCGQSFLQLNRADKGYRLQLFSYFESEGDQDRLIKADLLEDEIWTRLRLAPQALPTGEIEIIPGAFYSRLSHTPMRPEKAVASMTTKDGLYVYAIRYNNLDRELIIRCQADFPHVIEGWSERYTSGFGADARVLETTATRINTIKLDYWRHNDLNDAALRSQLGLKP
ncbi:MAG: hypothetical protein R3301_00525 [Saprospiraceae bacterium]|nr:hypothetical protein [Saprospiraceae bacterium]